MEHRIEELEAQVQTLQRRLTEAEAKAIRAEEQLSRTAVEIGIRDAIAKSPVPVHPSAMTDLIKRAAAGEWKEISGQLIRMDGGLPALDSNGHDMTPARWLLSLKADAPHLFAAADAAAGSSTKNPFSKDSWSLTEQGKLFQSNPDLARKLAADAGRKLEV